MKGTRRTEKDMCLENLGRTLRVECGLKNTVTPIVTAERLSYSGRGEGLFERESGVYASYLEPRNLVYLDKGTAPAYGEISTYHLDGVEFSDFNIRTCVGLANGKRIKLSATGRGALVGFIQNRVYWINANGRIEDKKGITAFKEAKIGGPAHYIEGLPLNQENIERKIEEAEKWLKGAGNAKRLQEWQKFKEVQSRMRKLWDKEGWIRDKRMDGLKATGDGLMYAESSYCTVQKRIKILREEEQKLSENQRHRSILIEGDVIEKAEDDEFIKHIKKICAGEPKMVLYCVIDCESRDMVYDSGSEEFKSIDDFYR